VVRHDQVFDAHQQSAGKAVDGCRRVPHDHHADGDMPQQIAIA
jgi:hypothetical protein